VSPCICIGSLRFASKTSTNSSNRKQKGKKQKPHIVTPSEKQDAESKLAQSQEPTVPPTLSKLLDPTDPSFEKLEMSVSDERKMSVETKSMETDQKQNQQMMLVKDQTHHSKPGTAVQKFEKTVDEAIYSVQAQAAPVTRWVRSKTESALPENNERNKELSRTGSLPVGQEQQQSFESQQEQQIRVLHPIKRPGFIRAASDLAVHIEESVEHFLQPLEDATKYVIRSWNTQIHGGVPSQISDRQVPQHLREASQSQLSTQA
jgi:hypothetical protein